MKTPKPFCHIYQNFQNVFFLRYLAILAIYSTGHVDAVTVSSHPCWLKVVLTASPLSPLLPFWPGPPISPCKVRRTDVSARREASASQQRAADRRGHSICSPCLRPLPGTQEIRPHLADRRARVRRHSQQDRRAPSLPGAQIVTLSVIRTQQRDTLINVS